MGTDDTSGNEMAGSKSMDSSHLYYLHSSDYPGMCLVNSIFDGKGYGGWRRSVLIALSAKNKTGFIDGSCLAPSFDSPNFKIWNRCNDMVLSWLLNSLSKEIFDSVIYSKTAKDLWTDMENRSGQSNGAKLYHLQKELSDLIQGSSDIAGYFTKMKKLWDELDTLNANINCGCNSTCGGKDKVAKSMQDERLIHFLMGLNDSYAAIRGIILIITPLPNINLAYSLLIQDEKQKEVYVNNQYPGESSSFLAVNLANGNHGNNDYKGKGKIDLKRNNLVCSYCKKPGHSVDKFYRLVGFPPDFKFTKSKRTQGGNQSNAVLNEGAQSNGFYAGNTTRNQHFTQEQVCQLINLLKQVKTGQSESTNSEAAVNNVVCSGPINEKASGSW